MNEVLLLFVNLALGLYLGCSEEVGCAIQWCKQPANPAYNLSSGVYCDHFDTVVTFPTSYTVFEEQICSILFKRSFAQHVKFKHVKGFQYGRKSSANLAYSMQKWALINLQPLDDLWMEFGVAGGFSVNLSATLRRQQKSSKPVYGFDWFQGLPETWENNREIGAFTQNGIIPPVLPNVKLIAGLFNETLEAFLKLHNRERVGYVNMDMDLYGGAHYVLLKLLPFFQKGSIIHFHEFYNILPWGGPETIKCFGGEELRALYDVLSLLSSPTSNSVTNMKKFGRSGISLQLLPYVSNFQAPLVFRVL
jgi:hypothetical protein